MAAERPKEGKNAQYIAKTLFIANTIFISPGLDAGYPCSGHHWRGHRYRYF